MTRKKKRRSSVVEIGKGPTTVRIYTINSKDGYGQFTLAWREGGRRRTRNLASMDEARVVAEQLTVRLANGCQGGDETTKRDIELLRHCESQAKQFGINLAAAMDEWVTTAASSLMAPIHNRLPAVLLAAESPEFLNGGSRSFQPFARPLTASPCASPLVKPRGADPQRELF
jgi:hypothetical protein